jgi:biotin transport system substrate-specific component
MKSSIQARTSSFIKERVNEKALFWIQVVVGSLFIALCSQIKLVLPFTPVPITLQTFAVMLMGALYGRNKGSLMVVGYFVQIALGFPVLAGGNMDPLAFIGPKGGYILGFLVQVYAMGWLIEKFRVKSIKALIISGGLSALAQLSCGVCWLSLFVGWNKVLVMGFYPFILGEALKVLAISLIVSGKELIKEQS